MRGERVEQTRDRRRRSVESTRSLSPRAYTATGLVALCRAADRTAGRGRRCSSSTHGPRSPLPLPILLPFLSIPSPSSPLITQIGGLNLRWYGTLLALGVLLGGRLMKHELARRGLDGERVYTVAAWAVPAGVIGARLYHVATDWGRFDGHLLEIPQLWHGGLGLPGVVAGGVLGAYIGARRAALPLPVVIDCIAPGLIAAQSLGRWGNWANQELFGGPSTLPWAVEIAPANRPAQYASSATFHPTFLYESLWNLLVVLFLYRLIRAMWTRLPAGTIFGAYLMAYSFGRFFIEGMRVDPANHVAGVRINQWLFATVFVVGTAWFLRGLRARAMPPARAVSPVPSGHEEPSS